MVLCVFSNDFFTSIIIQFPNFIPANAGNTNASNSIDEIVDFSFLGIRLLRLSNFPSYLTRYQQIFVDDEDSSVKILFTPDRTYSELCNQAQSEHALERVVHSQESESLNLDFVLRTFSCSRVLSSLRSLLGTKLHALRPSNQRDTTTLPNYTHFFFKHTRAPSP